MDLSIARRIFVLIGFEEEDREKKKWFYWGRKKGKPPRRGTAIKLSKKMLQSLRFALQKNVEFLFVPSLAKP